MIKSELKTIREKHCILSSEVEEAIYFVHDLICKKVDELKTNEPYAKRTIADLEIAEHEVFDLIWDLVDLEE